MILRVIVTKTLSDNDKDKQVEREFETITLRMTVANKVITTVIRGE